MSSASSRPPAAQERLLDTLDRLTRHHWPGNVRELEAAIECAVIWATGPTVRAGDLPPELVR